MTRFAIVASASGCGKTTVGRTLTVVWLDLPLRRWLPRLLRRTFGRIARREELWGGNRESLRGAFLGRDALIPYSLLTFRRRRRVYPQRLARFHVVRLHSQREVDRWLETFG
jgi:hypothetical protein